MNGQGDNVWCDDESSSGSRRDQRRQGGARQEDRNRPAPPSLERHNWDYIERLPQETHIQPYHLCCKYAIITLCAIAAAIMKMDPSNLHLVNASHQKSSTHHVLIEFFTQLHWSNSGLNVIVCELIVLFVYIARELLSCIILTILRSIRLTLPISPRLSTSTTTSRREIYLFLESDRWRYNGSLRESDSIHLLREAV